jgi:hypothetical protein
MNTHAHEHRAVRRSTLSSPPTRHRDDSRARANEDAREDDDEGVERRTR